MRLDSDLSLMDIETAIIFAVVGEFIFADYKAVT